MEMIQSSGLGLWPCGQVRARWRLGGETAACGDGWNKLPGVPYPGSAYASTPETEPAGRMGQTL